jgi:hypothetical protein
MRLTVRCWRAVAHRLAESLEPADVLVWAKVKEYAHGKRHAVIGIPLTAAEELVVMDILNAPGDDYMKFVVGHECKINPDMPQ